jgi:hypothetical protein
MVKAVWFRRYAEGERPAEFDRVVQSWDTANKGQRAQRFQRVHELGGQRQRPLPIARIAPARGIPRIKAHGVRAMQAQSWNKPRRVVANVEWHPSELYPRVGFIVTNLARQAERVVAFSNQRGTAEQWIKEGKGTIKWTRLSCRTFAANVVRLQLHGLAYNLGNFMRTLALPKAAETVVADQPAREADQIGAEVVRHGRSWLSRWPRGAVAIDVRRDPDADRPATDTAHASMKGLRGGKALTR